jgi:hypothetical protein
MQAAKFNPFGQMLREHALWLAKNRRAPNLLMPWLSSAFIEPLHFLLKTAGIFPNPI